MRRIRKRADTQDGITSFRWAIKIGAPATPDGDVWGDLFFAEDLAVALRARGQTVHVDRHGARVRPDAKPDDVILNLRGFYPVPPDEASVNIMWVISHPDWVSVEELSSGYDLLFAASPKWSAKMSEAANVQVTPLLQATNPERFRPDATRSLTGADVLFVGKSRNVYRPIVRDALKIGADLTIYGDGWGQFIPEKYVKNEFLANEKVPEAYQAARIVLNDHWEDMLREGFLSNRLFDAVGAGACVVSDDMGGGSEIFRGSVVEYQTVGDLHRLLQPEAEWPSPELRLHNAAMVALEHSFDRRAETLIAAVESRVGIHTKRHR